MTVGRDEGCDITLNDREVSRRHLLLRPAGGELGVEDLGSTNGTVVDGQQIAGAVNLADGGVVNIGTSEFIVQVVAAVPEEQRTAASPMPVAETATTGGPPAWFWTLTGLVEIGLILTAATLLVYYAVR